MKKKIYKHFDTEQSIQSTGKLERSVGFAGLEEMPENLCIILLSNRTRTETRISLMDSEIIFKTFLWFIY